MSLKMSAYGAGKVGTAPQEGLVRLGNNGENEYTLGYELWVGLLDATVINYIKVS